MQQVKCTYSSNVSIFTPGRVYDVKIVYGMRISDTDVALALIDDHDDVWGFTPTYRGGDVANADFCASFERY